MLIQLGFSLLYTYVAVEQTDNLSITRLSHGNINWDKVVIIYVHYYLISQLVSLCPINYLCRLWFTFHHNIQQLTQLTPTKPNWFQSLQYVYTQINQTTLSPLKSPLNTELHFFAAFMFRCLSWLSSIHQTRFPAIYLILSHWRKFEDLCSLPIKSFFSVGPS